MKRGMNLKFSILSAVLVLVMCYSVSAEVLTLNLNQAEFTEGGAASVFGYVLDDNLAGRPFNLTDVYLDGVFVDSTIADEEGYYELTLLELAEGTHNLSVNTSESTQRLTFTVFAESETPTYQIIASSLTVPFSSPTLTFTANKYLGTTLTDDTYTLNVYSENGSLYSNTTGVSGAPTTVVFPQVVGLYTLTVDGKTSFVASVAKFSMKFSITDQAGNPKEIFKPNGVAYFQIQGFSNGQLITNATVNAKITTPSGAIRTLRFVGSSGIYTSNTNMTVTGAPFSLVAGDYEAEFTMKDSSNNEQKVKGFFKVAGLSVAASLQNKKPYRTGDTITFDVVVKNLATGALVSHGDVTYTLGLEKEGKLIDSSFVSAAASTDSSITSRVSFVVPAGMADGDYYLTVKATSGGKVGKGKEFFKVQNTELFLQFSDNYGWSRDFFQPGEIIKVTGNSNAVISFINVSVYSAAGALQSETTGTGSANSISLTLNAPGAQADYMARIRATVGGQLIIQERWFSVQNYFSFLDVKNLRNERRFTIATDEDFLAEINAFDVSKGQGVDISSFMVKFDKIVNEETQTQYTSIKAAENSTLSSRTTGRVVFKILQMGLPNGPYRLEYTLVDSKGKSVKGKGYFGVSAFAVTVQTNSEGGQPKFVFSPGETVNVSVQIESGSGTATIYRDFFSPIAFDITDGIGSTLLKSSDSELPTESGWYPFGVQVVLADGKTGLGDGFFEVRSLNFRTMTAQNNGEFSSGDDILVDVIMEKSGQLAEGVNISIEKLRRAKDWNEVSATSGIEETNSQGAATLTITPSENLAPGAYFAEIRAEQGNSVIFSGIGFQVVGDKIIFTVEDADRKFSQTENINLNVKVTDSDNTPKEGVEVNLLGLMNLNTWGPVLASKSANTSANGVATITISAANFNPGRYAPIVNVSTLRAPTVGFGDGEFEIIPFDSAVSFPGGIKSFAIGEQILADITVTGSVTVAASVVNQAGASQNVDYYYADGILTLNNNLLPGEYFLDVAITSGTKSKTSRLWFEVLAPWANLNSAQPFYAPDGEMNFTYTIFTSGANGWRLANATLSIANIQNMWTGGITAVEENFSAEGTGDYQLDLGQFGLTNGDYLLNMRIPENPNFNGAVYFRVQKGVFFNAAAAVDHENVTVNVTHMGAVTSPSYTLEYYYNHNTFTQTIVNETNEVGEFHLNNLGNAFYKVQMRVEDDGDEYTFDTYFDVQVREVEIEAPDMAYKGDAVSFNISSTISTNFWIIDPFTQKVLMKKGITAGDRTETYTFAYPGWFIYSFGSDKRQAMGANNRQIEVRQVGFDVVWPMRWKFQLNEDFHVNVTTPITNTTLMLRLKSHFTGQATEYDLGRTPETANEKMEFSQELLIQGPQEAELVLQVSSGEKPRAIYFFEVVDGQYDMKAWTDRWEYRAGDTITIRTDVFDIINNQRLLADGIVADRIDAPFGGSIDVDALEFTSGNDFATIQTDGTWVSGNYHLQINITEGVSTQMRFVDFFVRGNDNLQLNWFQNKWDLSSGEVYQLTVDAKDKGTPAAGVQALLFKFESRPNTPGEQPEDVVLPAGSYNFSTEDNTTNANGRIVFYINLTAAGLASGGYTGRLNIGGQIVWFDFNVKSYRIEAYTRDWEYGLTDTIELNVRARDIDTFYPIAQDGTVKILEIRQHEMGNWQFTSVPIEGFGLTNDTFEVSGGEALIEMVADNDTLLMTKPQEFELMLQMNLSSAGSETTGAWFRVTNTVKPQLSIVDQTGEEPEAYFAGQNYTIEVTGPEGMTAILRNIWGPQSMAYNTPLVEDNDTLVADFISPQSPGIYNVEVQIVRPGSYPEYLNDDFQIGSGIQMDGGMMGNAIPGINFSVDVFLMGEGEDPWCARDQMCTQDWPWFGPLGNKPIVLEGIKDLSGFTYTDLSGLGITEQTEGFPEWMFPEMQNANCGEFAGEDGCSEEESCAWAYDPQSQSPGEHCMDLNYFCSLQDEEGCVDNTERDCVWDGMMCNRNQNNNGGQDQQANPGRAVFTLNPTVLNLSAGKKYDLIFTYTDGNDTAELRVFAQVEAFHVPISRLASNLAPNSEQQVWLKTTGLDGSAIAGCAVEFSGIYDESGSIVKSIGISDTTDENGEMEFSYIAPALPGYYAVLGTSRCNVSGREYSQDLGSKINVGSRALEVDMRTRYPEDEPMRIALTTKDRLGNPKSQMVSIQLFHMRDDYDQPVYPVSTVGCTAMNAGPQNSMGVNSLSVQTDASGSYELNLCPLPGGSYDIKMYPMSEFATKGGGGSKGMEGEDYGFYGTFLVSSVDVSIESELAYLPGDSVTLDITALDENGEPVEGAITALYVKQDSMGGGDVTSTLINSMDVELELTNGNAEYTFDIPYNVTEGNETVPLYVGPVWVQLLIEDSEGDVSSAEAMPFVIKKSDDSSLTTEASAWTNSLIRVDAGTDNLEDYKVQFGAFFFKENPDKGKDWMIENGLFFEDTGDGSEGSFKVLTPSEPGIYLLGLLVFPLGTTFSGSEDPSAFAEEILISPIEVKLDSVNVTGVVLDSTDTPIEGALVSIGKSETFTDADGLFSMEIPKGRKSMSVEKKTESLKQFMKSGMINFNETREINVSFYGVNLGGTLQQTFFNITSPGVDLTTMKLGVNVSVENTGAQDLNNFSLKGIASSGEELQYSDVAAGETAYVFISQLYAGFRNGDYTLKLRAEDPLWNSSGYILVDGEGVNSSVGAVLTLSYTVETYATPGNGIDDDGDGRKDEEMDNGIDDDLDGLLGEDLKGEAYTEYCGNGFCSFAEYNAGNCFEDCAKGSVCGDGQCGDDEKFQCPQDCEGQVEMCENNGNCNPDGTFCNNKGAKEPAPWCQLSCDSNNCWKCSTQEVGVSTECEQKGCTVVENFGNIQCVKPKECGQDRCQDCTNQDDCSGTGLCQWKQDNGQCERPWRCDANCQACSEQGSCEDSPANMSDNGCRWVVNGPSNGWCEWDTNYMPPSGGGQGIVKNIWLGETNTTRDFLAEVDWKGYTGRSGVDHEPGEYYIIVHMGGTRMNVTVDGLEAGIIDNEGGVWRDISLSTPYQFTNGSYTIELRDLIGPDFIHWDVVIGRSSPVGPSYDELNITGASSANSTAHNIQFNIVLEDLMDSPLCGGQISDESESWYITVDSIADEGCPNGEWGCMGGEDYRMFTTVDADGNNNSYFEYWEGFGWTTDERVNMRSTLMCHQSTARFKLAEYDVDSSPCEEITWRAFTTTYHDGEEGFVDSLDHNTHVVNQSGCGGGGSVCGNSRVEMGEQCDNGNLTGRSCTHEDFEGLFTGGILRCNSTCGFNTTGCTSSSQELVFDWVLNVSGNHLNLHEALNNVISEINKTHMPDLLADGTMQDESDLTTIGYSQHLLPSADTVRWGNPDPDVFGNNPSLYLDQSLGLAYEYRVVFDTPLNATALDNGEEINLLAEDFFWNPDLEQGDLVLVLHNDLVEVELNIGESYDDGNIHIEYISGYNETVEAELNINGQARNLSVGENVFPLGYGINARDIQFSYNPYVSNVTLFITQGTIEIAASGTWSDVIIDGEAITGYEAKVQSGDPEAVDRISFRLTPGNFDEDQYKYLQPNEVFVDPLFGTLSMMFGNSTIGGAQSPVTPGLMDPDKKRVSLTRSGDDYLLSFINNEGDDYEFSLFHSDSGSGVVEYAADFAGESDNITDGQIFILNEGDFTLVYELTSVVTESGSKKAILRDLYDDSEMQVGLGEEIGDSGVNVVFLNDGLIDYMELDEPAELFITTIFGGEIEIGDPSNTHAYEFTFSEGTANFTDLNPSTDKVLLYVNVSGDSGDEDITITNIDVNAPSNIDIRADGLNTVEYGLSEYGTYYELEKDNLGSYLDIYFGDEEQHFGVLFRQSIGEDS